MDRRTVAYGSGTKCEIVHRRSELAVLTFGHSLIHTCNRPAKSRALHFNPGARNRFGDNLHSSPPWKWAIAVLIAFCCGIYVWTLQ